MGWRSNQGISATTPVGPPPAEIATQLRRHGVTHEFLGFLREHSYTPEQVLLFFESGGQLNDLHLMTGYRQPAQPASPAPAPATQRPADTATLDELLRAPPVSAPRQSRSARRRTGERPEGWRDEVIAHGGLTIIFALVVIANGVATIFGIVSLMPLGFGWLIFGLLVGAGVHLVISRIELAYMKWQYVCSWFALPLVGAMVLDVGTSVEGFLWLSHTLFPGMTIHGLPPTIWNWGPLVTTTSAQLVAYGRSVAGETVDANLLPPPAWASQAWLILLIMSGIALGSERLLRWSYRRLREVLEAI